MFNENDSTFVNLVIENDRIEKRLIELGISDGIYTEIMSGLKATDKIKVGI